MRTTGTTEMSDTNANPNTESEEAPLYALLAEYETPTDVVAASKKVRDAGFKNWDTYTPFPIHGMERAMGIPWTVLPWLVFFGGLTGCATALTLQWWTNAYDYAYIISGKPFWSIPANIPVTFELTVLFSALTAVFGMLALNKLPQPSSPLDHHDRFVDRVNDDRFFLVIEAKDPKFDEDDTRELLETTNAVIVDEVAEDTKTSATVPAGVIYGLVILTVASLIPFAIIAKARESKSRETRYHIIPDMDTQYQKYKTQKKNAFFDDGRAMRLPVEGTVAVGALDLDDHFFRGKNGNAWARTFPDRIEPSAENMERGRERFGIYCAPCHGITGAGAGMVAIRAKSLAEGTWVDPMAMTKDYLLYQPVGQLFNTITNGIRNMPPYAAQIPPEDRWKIIMYMRALQRNQMAMPDAESTPTDAEPEPVKAPEPEPTPDEPPAPVPAAPAPAAPPTPAAPAPVAPTPAAPAPAAPAPTP